MLRRSIFCLLGVSTFLAANAKLDKLMPMDIQKYSGVYYLSDDQKAYLADWLGEHMNQCPQMGTEAGDANSGQMELSLSENIDGGKFLRLSDNSLWEVDPVDLSRSKVWLFPFPVLIKENGRKDFPYTIMNLNTGSKVDARKTSG